MIIRNLEAIFSFKYDDRRLKQATMGLEKFSNVASSVMGTIAGTLAVKAVKGFMDDAAASLDHIGKTASKLGLTVEQLQSFRFAAEQSGVSINTFDMAMQRFMRRSAEAAKSTGETKDALIELGVSATDSSGRLRDPITMMEEVADAIAAIPDQGDRVRLAMRLFDSEGVALVNLLQGGSKNIKNLRQEAHELGFVLGKEATDAAANYNDAMNRLYKTMKGLFQSVLVQVMPTINSMADVASKAASHFKGLAKRTSFLRAIFIALGVTLAIIAAKAVVAFAPFFAALAVIAAVALLIDDVWAAFTGGESVSKKVFDQLMVWFAALKGYVLTAFKRLWDFLPADLKKNLVAGFKFLKVFIPAFVKFVIGATKKIWTFIFGALSKYFSFFIPVVVKIFKIFKMIGKKIARILIDRISDAIETIKGVIQGIIDFIPDFVKKGFFAAVDYVSDNKKKPGQSSQQHLAPRSAISNNHIQNRSNQNVNVSVNVKSGANPQEIGDEVSRTFTKLFERERKNAFMGVSQYAI